MSVPFCFYGKGTSMSADLKRVAHRVRTSKPEFFAARVVRETSMNGDGHFTTNERRETKANPLEPSVRHRMSLNRRWF